MEAESRLGRGGDGGHTAGGMVTTAVTVAVKVRMGLLLCQGAASGVVLEGGLCCFFFPDSPRAALTVGCCPSAHLEMRKLRALRLGSSPSS